MMAASQQWLALLATGEPAKTLRPSGQPVRGRSWMRALRDRFRRQKESRFSTEGFRQLRRPLQ